MNLSLNSWKVHPSTTHHIPEHLSFSFSGAQPVHFFKDILFLSLVKSSIRLLKSERIRYFINSRMMNQE
jgi:hypothetical protein